MELYALSPKFSENQKTKFSFCEHSWKMIINKLQDSNVKSKFFKISKNNMKLQKVNFYFSITNRVIKKE